MLFEEKCAKGLVMDSRVKFADFTTEWMTHKRHELRPNTYASYQNMLPRANIALGHMRMDRIQPQHLLRFYDNLAEGGMRADTKYKCTFDLSGWLRDHRLSKAAMERQSGVAASNILSVTRGNNCTRTTAEAIARAVGEPMDTLFAPVGASKSLSNKTILNYHRMLSSVFSTAVEWGVLFSNPCERTKPPRVEHKDPRYLDEKQAAVLLDLLEQENPTLRAAVRLLLFTGLRRGEALGLTWDDIDFENATLQVCRSSMYLPDKGIFEDETKNTSSYRVIKVPATVLNDLRAYRPIQIEQQLRMGDQWHESDRIFTSYDGRPLHPDTLSGWFSAFMKSHTDVLPYITLHSLRHTNATLQIAGGVPLTTVAKRLGHANTNTTGRIYAHAIRSADEAAAETLENILAPTRARSAG